MNTSLWVFIRGGDSVDVVCSESHRLRPDVTPKIMGGINRARASERKGKEGRGETWEEPQEGSISH